VNCILVKKLQLMKFLAEAFYNVSPEETALKDYQKVSAMH
jgi:hypothetical protein